MIPLLTLMGDFMGVIGGAVVSTQILKIDSYAYWKHTRDFLDSLDIFAGVFKSYFFGAAIALISCHRGFHSRAGAEGVGRAATEAFVYSFIAILFLDFVLGLGWNNVYRLDLAPVGRSAMSPARAADSEAARALIELRDVSIRFRYESVLRNINLAIQPNETVCIIGESGCGKTVMLKLIIGLLRPTTGQVLFDGADVVESRRQAARQDAIAVRVSVPDGRALRQPDGL